MLATQQPSNPTPPWFLSSHSPWLRPMRSRAIHRMVPCSDVSSRTSSSSSSPERVAAAVFCASDPVPCDFVLKLKWRVLLCEHVKIERMMRRGQCRLHEVSFLSVERRHVVYLICEHYAPMLRRVAEAYAQAIASARETRRAGCVATLLRTLSLLLV